MKKLSILIGIAVFCLSITSSVLAQTEIKGSGNTAATYSEINTNSNSPVDTIMVVRDDGNVGIGTVNPSTKLEVNGTIYTAIGGIQFPDLSVQTTAATGGGVAYQNVFTVSPSGGDFTSISAALGACVAPGPNNTYHIRVMPGTYNEAANVICKKYVHLKGAGKYTTIINGLVVGADSCVIEDFYLTEGVSCVGTSPTILHNIITNTTADNANGIYISQEGHPWIKENEILDCSGWGIWDQDFIYSDVPYPWIIANKIMRNNLGGIYCQNTSPTISNNFIFDNTAHGIYLVGVDGTPAEPTIDDNQIGSTDQITGGIGIFMTGYAEPRIIANDIYICEYGIFIASQTPQPSIIGNNINYNFECGIYCTAIGASKPVVIKSNHIHSNGNPGAITPAGIYIATSGGQGGTPIISHNNIHNNYFDPAATPTGADIDYVGCAPPSFPMISLNVFDNITTSGAGATGSFNVNSIGNPMAP